MLHKRSSRVMVGGALAMVLAVSACGGAASSEDAQGQPNGGGAGEEASAPGAVPELSEFIEQAREEGKLTLNWGHTNLADALPVLFPKFNEYYGLDLELDYTPQSSMPGNAATLIEEYNAGRPASSDAFWGVQLHVMALEEAGVLDTDPGWDEWGTNIKDEMTDGPEGETPWAVGALTLYGGLAHNTDLIPEEEVPTTPEEVLAIDAALASTPYAAMFDKLPATMGGEEELFEWLEEFSPKIEGLIACGDIERIASGEFAALFIACDQSSYLAVKDRGAPVGFAPVKDMAIAQHNLIGFPKHAEHPAAARLWANYLVTPEAQEIMYEHNYADFIGSEGSQTAAEIAELEDEYGVDYILWGIQDELELRESLSMSADEYNDKIRTYFE